MKLQPATKIAAEIIQTLQPDCIQIHVAGSVRRRVPHVKDIEIVYIPKTTQLMDLFGAATQTYIIHTDNVITTLIDNGTLIKDTTVKRWGTKYKRLVHCASGIVIELFRAEIDNWGYILALRTGSADFNKVLVTKQAHGGALPPEIELRDGYVWYEGAQTPVPTEHAFFTALNLPLIPPQNRTVEQLRRCIKERQNR